MRILNRMLVSPPLRKGPLCHNKNNFAAITERIICDESHAVRDDYDGEVEAPGERLMPDGGYCVAVQLGWNMKIIFFSCISGVYCCAVFKKLVFESAGPIRDRHLLIQ